MAKDPRRGRSLRIRRIAHRLLTTAATASVLLAATVGGRADETKSVPINNGSRYPISKLYIWPSDLVPRTYSSISTPIKPQSQVEVDVEDIYNSCIWSVRAVFAISAKRRNIPGTTRRPFEQSVMVENVDLCQKPVQPVRFN